MVRPAFLDWILPSGDNLVLVPCRRGFWVGMLGLLVGAIPVAAQPLDSPLRTVSCDPARSPLYQSGSDLKAACEQRVYELPATDSLALKQDKYDGVFVEAWDSSATVMEAIIVMRKPTQSEATAALSSKRPRARQTRLMRPFRRLTPTVSKRKFMPVCGHTVSWTSKGHAGRGTLCHFDPYRIEPRERLRWLTGVPEPTTEWDSQ